MATISFEIPNDLLIAIANKAQTEGIEFVPAALDLMQAGLNAQKKLASSSADAPAFIQRLIDNARTYRKGHPFTTEALVSPAEWDSVSADTRKAGGRGFSKAVKDGLLPEIRNTGKKTLQNKSIYVRD